MALSADRDTPEAQHPASMLHEFTGADSTQFYKGGIVVLDQADGKLKKGSTDTACVAVGRCEENYLTGSSNTRKIKAKSGIFRFGNSASSDAIAADDIGKDCYIVDDETVALTDGSATRSKAGTIYDVDSSGVWVHILFPKA
jgi:hypothetical protein